MKAIKYLKRFLMHGKMKNGTDDAKKYCYQLLRTHLTGGWKDVKFEDLEFRRLLGGSTCSLCYVKSMNCEPKEVIVRFHYANDEESSVYDLKFIGETAETLVFHIFSELSFGPKLISVFNGGRIEEYIPSTQLPDQMVLDRTYHKVIIKKLAFIHSLDMPIVKDEKWISRFYENYEQAFRQLQVRKQQIIDRNKDNDVKASLRELFKFDLINELFWFKECLSSLGCRLVFSHNDITKRNILIKTDDDLPLEERCVIIDFGDCSYNFRGLDLADYLRCMVSIARVIRDGEQIKFYTDKEIEEFCSDYLDEFRKVSSDYDAKLDNVNQLQKEVYFFLLLSDLMTIMYITLSSEKSKSHKANWTYAIKRIALYEQSKKTFFEKYGDQVDFKETL